MATTFKQYLESQGKSKSTINHYSTYLVDFLSFLDRDNTEPENATGKEITAYLNHLKQRGNENKTRGIRLGVIRHFFDFQIEHGHRKDNPAKTIKIRGTKHVKLYPILSRAELEQIYTAYEIPSEEDPRNKRNWFATYRLSRARNKAVLSLMIHQGLTTAEVDKLQLNDLKLKQGEIYIAGSRKSNERTLELKASQIMELMEYQFNTRSALLKFCDQETKNLFISSAPLGQSNSSRTDSSTIWKRLSEEVKEQHPRFINFKQVRTSVITQWLGQYNLRQVQYMAGHRYVSSTEAYMVNQMEDLQQDIEQFHPMG